MQWKDPGYLNIDQTECLNGCSSRSGYWFEYFVYINSCSFHEPLVGITITDEEANEKVSNLSCVMLLGSSEPGLKAKKSAPFPNVKQTCTGMSRAQKNRHKRFGTAFLFNNDSVNWPWWPQTCLSQSSQDDRHKSLCWLNTLAKVNGIVQNNPKNEGFRRPERSLTSWTSCVTLGGTIFHFKLENHNCGILMSGEYSANSRTNNT